MEKSEDELFIRARIDVWILGSILSIISQTFLVVYESNLAWRVYQLRDERNFGQSLIHLLLTKCCLLCLAYLAYTISIVTQAWNNIFHHFAWILGNSIEIIFCITCLTIFSRILQKSVRKSAKLGREKIEKLTNVELCEKEALLEMKSELEISEESSPAKLTTEEKVLSWMGGDNYRTKHEKNNSPRRSSLAFSKSQVYIQY